MPTQNYPFIVLEGTHGAGKTTIANALSVNCGFQSLQTPSPFYDSVREYIHADAHGVSRFLFYLASIVDASHEISKLLKHGPVVCDRYIYSSIAGCHLDYGLEVAYLQSIQASVCSEILLPDKVFFLHVDRNQRQERLKQRPKVKPYYKANSDLDRAEALEKIHMEYFFNQNNWDYIDTTDKTVDEVVQEITFSLNASIKTS